MCTNYKIHFDAFLQSEQNTIQNKQQSMTSNEEVLRMAPSHSFPALSRAGLTSATIALGLVFFFLNLFLNFI